MDRPQQELLQRLNNLWETQIQEVQNTVDFNHHALPLSRIKKIMKANEDVKKVAVEAPVMLSKACEMFIMELTMRAWVNTEDNKRITLKKSDLASAIAMTDWFDFLVDTVPRGETMEREVYVGIPPIATLVATNRSLIRGNVQNGPPPPLGTPHPYYYLPSSPPQHFGAGIPPGMVMEGPPFDHPICGEQPPYPYAPQAPQCPAPKDLMRKNFSYFDDQTKN